jgi:TPR repeat protein
LYLNGKGVRKDIKTGIDLMLSSADSGNDSAKAVLSYYYCLGIGVKTDYKIARELFDSCKNEKLEMGAKNLLEEVKQILGSLDKYKPSIESVLSRIDLRTTKMFLDILK